MVSTFLGLFLVGCLDAPDYPDALKPVESIHVLVKQKGEPYSTVLKVHPYDSAQIKVKVVPEKYLDDLTFEWRYSSGKKDSLLKRGKEHTFYPSDSSIPNTLIAIDKEGNRETKNFEIVVNTPPTLLEKTVPAKGDTLYGSKGSAFLFSWYSMDSDLQNNDTLFHTLDIDGKEFDVGTLIEVKQSGLAAGEHKFRIIVRDLYGDADTLSYQEFYVIDTLEVE